MHIRHEHFESLFTKLPILGDRKPTLDIDGICKVSKASCGCSYCWKHNIGFMQSLRNAANSINYYKVTKILHLPQYRNQRNFSIPNYPILTIHKRLKDKLKSVSFENFILNRHFSPCTVQRVGSRDYIHNSLLDTNGRKIWNLDTFKQSKPGQFIIRITVVVFNYFLLSLII